MTPTDAPDVDLPPTTKFTRRWRRRGYAVGIDECVDFTLHNGIRSAKSIAVSISMEAGTDYWPTVSQVRRALRDRAAILP